MLVMLIHCYYGYHASGGPAGVGVAVGRAVRTSIVASTWWTCFLWHGHLGHDDHGADRGVAEPMSEPACAIGCSALSTACWLIVMSSLGARPCALFNKSFTPVDQVTVRTERAGLQLLPHSDVKVRGLIVGEVRDIRTRRRRRDAATWRSTRARRS